MTKNGCFQYATSLMQRYIPCLALLANARVPYLEICLQLMLETQHTRKYLFPMTCKIQVNLVFNHRISLQIAEGSILVMIQTVAGKKSFSVHQLLRLRSSIHLNKVWCQRGKESFGCKTSEDGRSCTVATIPSPFLMLVPVKRHGWTMMVPPPHVVVIEQP